MDDCLVSCEVVGRDGDETRIEVFRAGSGGVTPGTALTTRHPPALFQQFTLAVFELKEDPSHPDIIGSLHLHRKGLARFGGMDNRMTEMGTDQCIAQGQVKD